MRRRQLAAVIAVVASFAVGQWPLDAAWAQRRSGAAGRRGSVQPAGPTVPGAGAILPGGAPAGPAAGAYPPQFAPTRPADTQNARQVSVEILFIEVTRADAPKAKPPALTGKAADVEKALADLKLHGQLKTLQRIRMSVLDGRKATSQLSETKPVVYGTTVGGGGFGPAGRVSRSYRMTNFGTVLAVTPIVEPKGSVVLDLQFEKSGPQSEDDSPKEPGETTAPGGSRTITFRNTFRVSGDEFVTVTSSTHQSKKGTTQILVIAKARLDAKPAKTAAVPPAEMSVIRLQHTTAASAAETLRTLFMKRKVPNTLSIAVDERTNAVIVRGDRASLEEIKALLIALDEPAKAKR